MNTWNVTVSSQLHQLGFLTEYNEGQITELHRSDYSHVRRDHHEIQPIVERRLHCRALTEGGAICAKGYDPNGRLTHIGLANISTNPNIADEFLRSLDKIIEGKVFLFIAADTPISNQETFQHPRFTVMEDLTEKNLFQTFPGHKAQASYIRQAFFDRNFTPHLHLELKR